MAYPTDPIYKLYKNLDGVVNCILHESGGRLYTIPICDGNHQYEQYKKWVADGNTPEAAD